MALLGRLGVLCLLGASGCAALIFEVTWLQLLQLVVGSSAVSLGILLATYMGGMCIGAFAAPRLVSPKRHPLRAYAALELAIGMCGLAELFAIPFVGRAYSAHVGYGFAGFLLRGLVSGICLLPPTMLMGAALPIAVRWFKTSREQVAWAGRLYAANIAGAVIGCLGAGFYLLRVHDMFVATLAAAVIEACAALAAFALSFSGSAAPPLSSPSALDRGRMDLRPETPAALPAIGSTWTIHLAIALSGFCALGAEVIWTRLLSLLLGGTVYTFSIVLAVVLFGLALGSGAQAQFVARVRRPHLLLGGYQILITAAIAWAAFMIARVLPYWSIDPVTSQNALVLFELEVLRCLLAILPAACLWGASFPLALGVVPAHAGDPARPFAGIYAANTFGAIAGALTTSLWIIPVLGTQRGAQLLIGLSTIAGLTVMGTAWAPGRPAPRFKVRLAALGASCAVAVLAARSVAPVPAMVLAYGRYASSWMGHLRVLYAGEGTDSPVAVTESPSGSLSFHVSGKVEASNELLDMRLQLMLGHLPALVDDHPRSVLVVGMGTGITAGAFLLHPDVTRIVVAEVEPLVPIVAARFFGSYNNHVERDRRVQIVHDDARHYIQTTTETFDVITTDPIHPWVKGSAALYTREFFEIIARHLRPGGVVAQWVPLYETTADVVKTELATFFDVFPQGTIWDNGIGWDLVLLGQTGAPEIDVNRMDERLHRTDHARVLDSLGQVQLGSATDLLATYAGRASDLRPWTAPAERNRDLDLRLQYLAGFALNNDEQQQIYDQILAFSRFPSDLFVASDDVTERLKATLDAKEGLRQSLAERRSRARRDDR